ncbi:hypothetical protein [Sphingobium sufflavum]|nr:hypothetical protein [Sphingobium sufflavum]
MASAVVRGSVKARAISPTPAIQPGRPVRAIPSAVAIRGLR